MQTRSPRHAPRHALLLAAVAVPALGLAASGASAATSVFFDLEDLAPAAGLSTLTLTDPAVTATITRGGQAFDVVDLSAGSATSPIEMRSIVASGDVPATGVDAPFVVDFSTLVSSFGVDLGDFGDDDDSLVLTAYSGPGATGTVIATDTADLPNVGTAFQFVSLLVEGDGIGSVSFIGGSLGDNSTAVDNIGIAVPDAGGAAVVPLPAGALAAIPTGLIALGVVRRRRAVTA